MKKIKFLTGDRSKTQIQTLDISIDRTINWNNIKQQKDLRFTTIDYLEIIESLIIEINSAHINQAQGTPLTIGLLVSQVLIASQYLNRDRNSGKRRA